jgi:hypothetical protein
MVSNLAGRIIVGFFLLIAVGVTGVGGWQIWDQHRQIATYQPVAATVLASRVEVHRGSKSTTYRPDVEYRYQVAGQMYSSRAVLPARASASSRWAHEVVRRYPPGAGTTAYHDPGNPAAAFLYRHYSFAPYLLVFMGMIFVTIVLALLLGGGGHDRAPTAPAIDDGWFALKPTSRIGRRQAIANILAVLWCGVVGLAWGHYVAVADRPLETAATVVGVVGLVVGGILVGMAIYYWLLERKVGDAVVAVSVPVVNSGEPFTVRVTQALHDNVLLEEMRVGLQCQVTTEERRGNETHYTTRTCFEESRPAAGADFPRAGEHLEAHCELLAPAGQPSSTPTGLGGYPRYEWFVTVCTQLTGSPDYRAKFPVRVR